MTDVEKRCAELYVKGIADGRSQVLQRVKETIERLKKESYNHVKVGVFYQDLKDEVVSVKKLDKEFGWIT